MKKIIASLLLCLTFTIFTNFTFAQTGKIAGKVAMKVGAKFLGPVGVAITARDAYKSYKDVKGGMKVGKALKKNFLGL